MQNRNLVKDKKEVISTMTDLICEAKIIQVKD